MPVEGGAFAGAAPCRRKNWVSSQLTEQDDSRKTFRRSTVEKRREGAIFNLTDIIRWIATNNTDLGEMQYELQRLKKSKKVD